MEVDICGLEEVRIWVWECFLACTGGRGRSSAAMLVAVVVEAGGKLVLVLALMLAGVLMLAGGMMTGGEVTEGEGEGEGEGEDEDEKEEKEFEEEELSVAPAIKTGSC